MVAFLTVVAFDRNRDGALVPGKVVKAQSLEAATRRALEWSFAHAGALALRGTPGKVEVVAAYGEVDVARAAEAASVDSEPSPPILH